MSRATLLGLATAAATAGLWVLKAKPKGPKGPPKPKPTGEANTYDLPDGLPIGATLRKWFKTQAKAILGTIPEIGAPLPEAFAPLADYDDRMASAMTPLIGAYWQESGERVMERLGLDPDAWQVTNPHLAAKVEHAALRFCKETNATTSMQLEGALAKLRTELHAGLVERGESIPELTKRVKGVFEEASTARARRIATTEASLAVHSAQIEAARQSGVVVGKELLVSADACPLCQQVASEAKVMKLDTPFAVVGHNQDYSVKQSPPLHPSCRCAMVEVLATAYGGPADPEFGATLIQPKPGPDYVPPAGKPVPVPEPEKLKPKEPPYSTPHKVAPDRVRHPQTPPEPNSDYLPEPPEGPLPKPKPKPKPKAPRTPAPPPFPADPETLAVVRPLGGSTGAELVKDAATGTLYVRKRGSSPDHLREEAHADAAYRALGVPVPRSKLYETPSGPVKLAEFHEGKSLGELKRSDPRAYEAAAGKVRKHFVADAVLGNWDVVGQDLDNILVTRAGDVYRIDNGGALRYRAQGARKAASQWSAAIGEIHSLRDPAVNRPSAEVFGPLSDAEVKKQAGALLKRRAQLLAALPADVRGAIGGRLDALRAWADRTPEVPPKGRVFSTPGRRVTADERREMARYGREHWGDWARALPAREKAVLGDYQGYGYHRINGALRAGVADPAVPLIDKALARKPTPEDLVLYRGIKERGRALLPAVPPDQLVGALVRDKGFMSFSQNYAVSVEAFAGDRGALFRVTIPKGTPSGNLSVTSGDGDGEFEVLTPRGHRLRLTGYNGVVDGVPFFDAAYEKDDP